MQISKMWRLSPIICGVAIVAPACAATGTFSTIYTFGGVSDDGVSPMSPLIAKNGILYGTTFRGGPSSAGTVYSFDPATTSETVVTNGMGIFPFAPVIYRKGALVGTTTAASNGQGNIYSVDLTTKVVTNLYTFPRGQSQADPGALVQIAGKVYGTTYNAGNFGDGSVFKYDPATSVYTTLYSFTAGSDGKNPQGLIVNGGLLYGVATKGGTGGGTLFTVDPNTGTETTIYSFSAPTDGSSPSGIAFNNGMIYGTALFGGGNNDGTLFEFNPTTKKLSTIFTFPGGAGGCIPGGSPLIRGGHIYGVTSSCGDAAGQGILYKVSMKTGKESVLHTFSNGPDGVTPLAALLAYKGVIYGTTSEGGTNNAGTIFQYIP